MSTITTELFNFGEELAPSIQPNNTTSFLLSDDECAFVHALNLQSSSLKTMLISIVSAAEEQMEQQTKVLGALRDQFITALAKKHNIVIQEDGDFDIDLPNKLMLYKPKKEKE